AVGLAGELGGALADPLLAQLLAAETASDGRILAPALGTLAELLEPKVPRPARVACRWLRAVALERAGDIDAAERELLAAQSMDADWPLTLIDLARIASDRGDAEGGLALLNRADVTPEHPLVQVLQRHRTESRPGLGRNESCWCGSGRKYKKCHLGHEQLPLAERAGWLYHKATQHVLLGDWLDPLNEAIDERARYADDDDPDALDAALADPLPMDAVLFEGGAFAEFLQVRGALLPDDERALADQWLLVERSVFEVEQLHPGQGLTVRDVRTGDRHEVRERTASGQLKPGQLVCARVVPAGDTMQIFGGLEPVALHERGPLIELLDSGPEPAELVAELSRRYAPPVLTNTEGDPMVLCEASVQIGDPAGIEAALDETYDRADDEPSRWFEHVTTHGMQRIRATLVRDGDTLQVETNSDERMDRVLATLARLDPAMEVLDDTRYPVRDAREAAKLAEQYPESDADTIDSDDPRLAEALDAFIRDYETKWLDEPIPALNGYTPRQAADDPTRRGDLIKLLDSYPAGAAGRGGMDADRLRAALGLG
ncbi:MAG TPA: SEC-C domain-containing protein, partial [Mycobacterium sp.]|nr:SEC-C domain-containing protein [Mycobacterium sp.]